PPTPPLPTTITTHHAMVSRSPLFRPRDPLLFLGEPLRVLRSAHRGEDRAEKEESTATDADDAEKRGRQGRQGSRSSFPVRPVRTAGDAGGRRKKNTPRRTQRTQRREGSQREDHRFRDTVRVPDSAPVAVS